MKLSNEELYAARAIQFERESKMEYRTFGKSGIKVLEIGFGAWAIGGDAWGSVDDQQSIQVMNHALDIIN